MSEASHGIDVHGLSDDQLADLRRDVLKEQTLRRRLDASPEKIEHAIAEYQKATGKGSGESWKQPTGPMDAYRRGAIVEHEGEEWVSTTPNNVWEPGQSGWRLRPLTDPETGEEIPPPYVPPTGAHDSYQEGERITFDGDIYEAVRDGVVHSPAEYAPDWQLIEPEPEPEPEPPEDEEPVEPEEPEPGDGDGDEDDEPTEPELEPSLPEWKTGVDYQPGDRFTYNGHEYRVLQAHTSAAHWPPDQVASLYERQG